MPEERQSKGAGGGGELERRRRLDGTANGEEVHGHVRVDASTASSTTTTRAPHSQSGAVAHGA